MSRRRRREVEVAGISFLDAICCGFGAIVLLLVITKVHDPILTQELRVELVALVLTLEEQLLHVERQAQTIASELAGAADETRENREEIASLEQNLARVQSRRDATRDRATILAQLRAAAQRAEQSLSSEVERRRAFRRDASDTKVGGIPADSEYIIFVVDTSGSMRNYNWDRAVKKVEETLKVYPKVKGIQVLNDMGTYMFSQYAGKWISDTPRRRAAILQRMRGWQAFSNSSPVEGIEKAIRTFHEWDKKISIYVFGDEFTGESMQAVVSTVDRLNRPDARGTRRVRIHAVGFTIDTDNPDFLNSTRRFAALMRVLCQRNGGTFVGLPAARE